jgi:hypothetical protein
MSPGAESCLMHTTVPARTLLSGQIPGWAHCPSRTTSGRDGFFTGGKLG